MKALIPELHARQVWAAEKAALKVGDVVAVLDERNERGEYPLGRIVALRRSRSDGFPRAVELELKGTIVSRPVTRLIPLAASGSGDEGYLENDE